MANSTLTVNQDAKQKGPMANNTLSITDNRTGKAYTVPIEDGTVKAIDFRQMRTDEEDFGLMLYDPAFSNTASCRSSITFIDGDRGILEHRGYPIESLAEHCSFLEVAYLILFGELPTEEQLKQWEYDIAHHTMLHESIRTFMERFRYDAHPMSMLVSTVAALSTVYPRARNVQDPANRLYQIKRLVGKMPTIAAMSYRHSLGFPVVYPDIQLNYTENFMNMLWRTYEPKYAANPVLAHALDVLFILHADHEQNCSTNAMRSVCSSLADPYLGVASAASALSGHLHGGANEDVIKMLSEIGSKSAIPGVIESVKAGKYKLMGFGHRVYKSYDPRANLIKKIADQVFQVTGQNPMLEIALELERIALQDEYFIKRKLYPNVDFYSGLIYQAIGFKPEMFTVLFAIPRTIGWLSQWNEMMNDPDQKIVRPRQIYTGKRVRRVLPIAERKAAAPATA